MPESHLRVHARCIEFWNKLKAASFREPTFLVHAIGWLISAFLLAFSLQTGAQVILVFIFLHAYFLFKFIRELRARFLPPVELLLLLFLAFFAIEAAYLRSLNLLPSAIASGPPAITSFAAPAQITLLALLGLLFSLILVQNNRGKNGIIIVYFLLGFFGSNFFDDANSPYLFFFQLLLVVLLLKRTTWLEELTKAECWIYLLLAYILLRLFLETDGFGVPDNRELAASTLWFTAPYYLYLLFKLYLIAVLVKIPVVLVYNHARLARKLYISGMFQSTFPQIIQLFILVLIFYFFIAGWQAENVRNALRLQIDEMKASTTLDTWDDLETYTFPINALVELEGYQPFRITRRIEEQGIVAVEYARKSRFADSPEEDYFLFFRPPSAAGDSVVFVKMNPAFINRLAKATYVLSGSQLIAYSYAPKDWETFLYSPTLLSDDGGIRIFRFALTPRNELRPLSAPIENRYQLAQIDEDLDFDIFRGLQLTQGRTMFPCYTTEWRSRGYYVFDVMLVITPGFFASPIFINIFVLFILYLLFNIFIIQRVIKFGSEINKMIVQKFNQLRAGIREISSGNLDYKVKIEGQDEFVELGERFNQMGDTLKRTIEEAKEKERLAHELDIARQVQLSLLPPYLPDVYGFQVAANLKTATEVGGDFYDIAPLGDNRFLFTIGDVSGKSTSAAFYMAQCISLIRFSPQFTDDPREITLRLNEYFADPQVDRQMFVTAIVGLLDANASTLRYVRAGHTLPFFIPADPEEEMYDIDTPGLGIGLARKGLMLEKTLKLEEVRMEAGDTLVLYTDGVVEAARTVESDANGRQRLTEFFGEEKLRTLLLQNRGKNALAIMQTISRSLEEFYRGQPPADDYTIMVIQKNRS